MDFEKQHSDEGHSDDGGIPSETGIPEHAATPSRTGEANPSTGACAAPDSDDLQQDGAVAAQADLAVDEDTEETESGSATNKSEVPFAAVADDAEMQQQPTAFSADLPQSFQNVAAKGGSVAAVTLGLLTIFGAFVTQWSIFNGVVGLLLGFWGFSSPLKKTTWVGIGCCLTGLALCVWLSTWP